MENSENSLSCSRSPPVQLEKLSPQTTDTGSSNGQTALENWGTFEFLDEFRRFKLGSCDTKKFSFNDETYSRPKELVKKIFQESFDCKILFGKEEIKDGKFKQTISVPDPDDDKKSTLPILNIDIISNSKLVQYCYLFIIRQTGEDIYQEVVKNVVEAAIKLEKPGLLTESAGKSVYDIIKNGELKIKFVSPINIFKGSNPSGRVGSFRNILITHRDRASATPARSTFEDLLKSKSRESLPGTPMRSFESLRPKSSVSRKPTSSNPYRASELVPPPLSKTATKPPPLQLKTQNPLRQAPAESKPQTPARKSRPATSTPPSQLNKLYGLQDLLSDLRLCPKPPAPSSSKQHKGTHNANNQPASSATLTHHHYNHTTNTHNSNSENHHHQHQKPHLSLTASTKDRSSLASNESLLNLSGFGWPGPSLLSRARTLDVGPYLVKLTRPVAETKVRDAADLVNQVSRFPEVQPMLARCGKILLAAHGIDISTKKKGDLPKGPAGGLKYAQNPNANGKDCRTEASKSEDAPFQYRHQDTSFPFRSVNEGVSPIGNSSWAISEAREEMRTKLQEELVRIHAKFFAGPNAASKMMKMEAPKPIRTRNVCVLDDDSDSDSVVCVPTMKIIHATPVAKGNPNKQNSVLRSSILDENQEPINHRVIQEESCSNPLTKGGETNPLAIDDDNYDLLESDSEWPGLFTTPTVNDLLYPHAWVTFKAEQLLNTQKFGGVTKEQGSWKGSATVVFGGSSSRFLAGKLFSQSSTPKTISIWAETRMALYSQLGITLGVLLFKDYSTMTVEQLWDRCTALVVQLPREKQKMINAKEVEEPKPVITGPATSRQQLASQYLGKRHVY